MQSLSQQTKKTMKPFLYGFGYALIAVVCLATSGCLSPGQRAKLAQDNESLRREVNRLNRVVAQREGTVSHLQRQVSKLQGFSPDRPATLFAPVKVEIASLTGGANYDDQPGDDGVNVYLRLLDADGDTIKAPGKITIQLVDNSLMGSPKVLGVYVFGNPQQLRETWYGKFGTSHYTLKCPFRPNTRLSTNQLDVRVEFIDYLTGRTLTAVKEVSIASATSHLIN